MAAKKERASKEEKYNYPSHFGSHASMVDQQATEKLAGPEWVVCKDEHGTYKTKKSNLDSGLADPYRNAWERLDYLCPKSKYDND